jgi:5'-3' exonuclease
MTRMSDTRLLLVDGSNVVMRCALGGDVPPAQAVPTATAMIERATREAEATHLVIALDSPGTPCWRKQIYADYKANRTRDTSPWILRAHAVWSKAGWWVEDVAGYEADDIIGTIAHRTLTRMPGRGSTATVLVLSGDSDVLPLTAAGARVMKPVSGGQFDTWTADRVQARYGLPAAKLTDFKGLAGESGDNVPGVRGIGSVRAQRLLAQHGDLEGVIAAGQRQHCKHSIQVAASANLARLSRYLVTLATDAPVTPIDPADCSL